MKAKTFYEIHDIEYDNIQERENIMCKKFSDTLMSYQQSLESRDDEIKQLKKQIKSHKLNRWIWAGLSIGLVMSLTFFTHKAKSPGDALIPIWASGFMIGCLACLSNRD